MSFPMDMNSVPAFVGTLPGWITSISCVSILGLVLRWQLGLRRLKIEADKVGVSATEIANKAEADIRDHYAKEVEALRAALASQSERHNTALSGIERRYQSALNAADERHDKCQKKVDELEESVKGLRSHLLQAQDSALALLPNIPDHIRDASERAGRALDNGESK